MDSTKLSSELNNRSTNWAHEKGFVKMLYTNEERIFDKAAEQTTTKKKEGIESV